MINNHIYSTFNQECDCCCSVFLDCLRIYDLIDLGKKDNEITLRHKYLKEGIELCTMYFRQSLIAVSGNSRADNPYLSPRDVALINIQTQQIIFRNTFRTSILNILMTHERIVIVLENMVVIYDFESFLDKPEKCLRTIKTNPNPLGLSAVGHHNNDENKILLAIPVGNESNDILCVQVMENSCKETDFYIRNSHQNRIVAMTMSFDSKLLATSSELGTVIRVFSLSGPSKGKNISSFQRGTSCTTITNLSFNYYSYSSESRNDVMISAISHTGTCHVFRLSDGLSSLSSSSSSNNFGYSYLPVAFQRPRSWKKIYLADCIVSGFSKENLFYLITKEGMLYVYLLKDDDFKLIDQKLL